MPVIDDIRKEQEKTKDIDRSCSFPVKHSHGHAQL